jgi:hypothetical protein
MRSGAVVIAMLGVILAGCEATATPSLASFTTSSAPAIALATASPSAPPAATPRPTPRATPLAPPPPPTGVRIRRQGCYWGSDSTGVTGTCITTITWKKAIAKGTEIRVYGVTGCLSLTERPGDGSCLVKHTSVPVSARRLIAKAPASEGKIVWKGPAWRALIFQSETDGPTYQYAVDSNGVETYFAIVVAAYNSAGNSKFVIADAGTWCYQTGCEGWGP